MKFPIQLAGLSIAAILLQACGPHRPDGQAVAVAPGTSVGSSTDNSPSASGNDALLHLAQPKYESPYGIPQEGDVKAVMDRVLNYLNEVTPATTEDGKLHLGTFRLTSYEWGVTYAAMIDASLATGDEAYLKYVSDRYELIARLAPDMDSLIAANPRYDEQMRRVLAPSALDDAGAMATALIRLQKTSRNDSAAYMPLIRRYIDYVMNRQYRLGDGTFARQRPHHNTVWLDDMYMGIPCLAYYGRFTGNFNYLNEAIRQVRLFRDKMWVSDKKLFRHGWVEDMTPHPSYHWGRANGWAILTLCEVLDMMSEENPSRPEILALLRSHIEGLCQLQDKTGFWHQLLDRPDTYLETSCTAIYCYCIAHAINRGWVDPLAYGSNVLLAWNAVTTQVNTLGQVEGTCVGTGMGFDPAFYAYRPVSHMAAHGYGPVIWAGAEVIQLLKSQHPKMNDSAVHLYKSEQKTREPIFSEDVASGEIF